MFDSNLDILNVLGAISMKIDMHCRETLFQHIQVHFFCKFESLVIKKIEKQKCRR